MTASQPPRVHPTLRLRIELSDNHADKPRRKMPAVRCLIVDPEGERSLGEIGMDEAQPRLPADDGTFGAIDAGLVLSRVMDEQAWLAELWRVLAPGGALRLLMPAGGPLAWLDAHNIYRYLTDITGHGTAPSATLPTGWNRHYHPDEIEHLLEEAGFEVQAIQRAGIGLPELPHLAGLIAGDYVGGEGATEKRLQPRRRRLERADHRLRLPGIGKTLVVTATKL